MRAYLFALLVTALLIASCTTYKSHYVPMQSGQKLTLSNEKGEKLFDLIAPIGEWKFYDRTKAPQGTKMFKLMYTGSNSGMINAEIRIMYIDSYSPYLPIKTFEEEKHYTTIKYMNESMAKLLDKNNRNNLQDFYKPKNLEHGIRNIAGLHCRYFSIVNHSGPTLDTPTAEFRGLGSGRKEENYWCALFRDGKPWYLGVHVVYSLSDVATQRGMNIDFYEMIKDFDTKLKPTLESLKLYGNLKQY